MGWERYWSAAWPGERFRNVHHIMPGLRDPNASMPTLHEFLCGGERRLPSGPLPSMNPLEAWAKPPGSGLRAMWLGHSTVLIEIDGVSVLIDPVWGPRASPSTLVGPKRFQPVPVLLRAMPPVDLVIVSHDHYDHLDYPTIRELRKRDVPFVTSLGVRAHLEAWGVRPERIVELDWWNSHNAPNTELVMLEVGAFHPAWGDMHPGPENALKALALLGGGAFLPVHWGTFSMAMHAQDQPAEGLYEWGPKAGAQLLMPRLGEAFEPAHGKRVEPWWRDVDTEARRPQMESPEAALPTTMPWPIDQCE